MGNELKSANSARPSAVKPPVPGKEQQATADDFLASFDAPEVGPQGADDFVNSVAGDPVAPPAGPTEDQFAPEPGLVQANIDQFSNLGDRVRAGLAANDTEKLGFLKKKYGDENAVMKNGNLWFRKDSNQKFKRFDPDSFELAADLLDFSREAVTEASMLPGEIAGGLIGAGAGTATAPGIGSVAGAAQGAYAGRVASVPLATAVADDAAQRAGVPQDPSRNHLSENLWGMGAEAVMPVAGRMIGKQIAKRIPGTAAYEAALKAGKKESVALSEQSQEVVRALGELEQEGLNLDMMAHQVHDSSPQLEKLARTAEEGAPGQFQQKQQEVAQGYAAAVKGTLQNIIKRANPDGKSGNIAENLVGAVEKLDEAEGKAIEKYRTRAMARLGNKKVDLPPELGHSVSNLIREYGFTVRSTPAGGVSVLPPKDIRQLIGKGGLKSAGEARALVNNVLDLARASQKGLRVTDVERFRGALGEAGRSLRGTSAGAQLSRLSGDMRQLYRDTIKSGLDGDIDKKLFDAAMDDFGMIRQNTEQLTNVLRADVTAKTIVNSIFKGKENLANVKAIKSLVGKDSPEWGALKEEFVNQMLLKHSGDGATGLKSGAFLKDLQKNYGDDFIREVLNDGKAGPNYNTIKNLLTVGERIEKSVRTLKVETASEKQKAAVAEGLFGLMMNAPYRTVNGLKKLVGATGDEENALMEIFNREGYEKYLANFKGDRGKISQAVESMLESYNARRAADTRVGQVLRAGEDVLKRGTKATIREGVMR